MTFTIHAQESKKKRISYENAIMLLNPIYLCAYTLHADLVMSFSARWSIFCASKWVGIDIYFENKLNFLLLLVFFKKNQIEMQFYLFSSSVVVLLCIFPLPLGNHNKEFAPGLKSRKIRTGAHNHN